MNGSITAKEIKEQAKNRGADLVGICSAQTLNENPPDPKWPQTPEMMWKHCRSVVALAMRVPWGTFQAEGRLARLYAPHLVMKRLADIALDLAYYVEDHGFRAVPVPEEYTDTALKQGTYGPLSLRHVAVEAGLGTLGLNLYLLTPEYGPRVYLTALLTDVEIEPDRRQEKRLCLGVSCGRCLLACTVNAVEHWGLNKRQCSTCAQRHGVPTLLSYLDKVITAQTLEERKSLARSLEVVDLWQALRIGAGAYAGCLHCMEVCPVGEDYPRYLKQRHAKIEKVKEREEKLATMRLAEQGGERIPGYEISQHWIGS